MTMRLGRLGLIEIEVLLVWQMCFRQHLLVHRMQFQHAEVGVPIHHADSYWHRSEEFGLVGS